ncbi:MAG: hypothetical protein COB60_01585 [Flavobacteriaceae bacterium]|nr:MAG: hypothetical protein COB60_01585 [Flavobacteriaceae bacterium]
MKNLFLTAAFLFSIISVNATNHFSAPTMEIVTVETIVKPLNLSALCKMVQIGNFDAVKALIENGADVNGRSKGMTPLMFAARHNKAAIAEFLILKGAKLKLKDKKGFTALKHAKLSKATDSYAVIEYALSK